MKDKIQQVWNAVTANGCREMDYERFEQAAKELLTIQEDEIFNHKTECSNCGEMVQMIGSDGPDGFCPKCYC